jgi:GGDEF domain-containing protein
LLIEAANRIRLSIRPIDLACRFGGDEFDVLANSSGELSVELEKLNLQVEQKN